ncbi:hypothetical protein AUK11_01285 [bacterium CG2_30_37_16]|nr:MAG: hypothetical protein AUK11_01285 [bacterium CG2_30_37_16]PIP31292.1 MAG: hypothetical protein COX25_00080 [bacterium (Candidatus Howlettbacteria) CG23_combo_of_CG06-09_8_20_14_all_37_9]PIX99079.1 MAG: hypothetical protein COZ22_03535 [bacterium (Candidatus Howlettbacteria) CG_4_10_14_3_um_filter_37_10]PJB05674.1 MAG: hypothetical protein CO123_03485 [bacterium (Candidatus Howlettbacteria) CG_4_9_14_3_um_filter_37_10]
MKPFLKKNREYIFIICVFILIKAFLFYWAEFNFNYTKYPDETAISIWDRWDTRAYKTIAEFGYTSPNDPEDYQKFLSHFPPLYPILIKAVSSVTPLSLVGSGILISLICALIASIYLFKLVKKEFDEKRAYIATFLFILYPISYFTGTIYTEGLFLMLVIMFFYYVRKEKYLVASVLAGLAILTRTSGIVLLPVIFYLFFSKKVELRNKMNLIIFPVIGLFIYLMINLYYFGDPLFFQQEYAQNFYSGKHLIVPFSESFNTVKEIASKTSSISDNYYMMTNGWNAIFVFFSLIVSLIGIRILPTTYSIYSLSSLLFISSYSWGISNARYTYMVFPMFMILSKIKNKITITAIFILFTSLLLYFTLQFTGGGWGF